MKENIYENNNIIESSSEATHSRKKKRCRSNNSSILSRTLTSSSSNSDISVTGNDIDSRSQSPDTRALDSNDENDIDTKENEQRAKSRKCNFYQSNHLQQHSTPVLQFNEHLYPTQFQMPSPKLYSQNYNNKMQFMSPLASLNDQHSYNNKPISVCAVCGDRASGKHYGVLSCDGCRGFFKRSIRGNMDYVCKENNKCVIDVSRRNQCQSCRLKKCLEVKMNKDAVQHQRPPRSYQIRRDTSSIETTTTTATNQKYYSNKIENSKPTNNMYRFSPYSLTPMMKNRSLEEQQHSPIVNHLMTNSSWNQLPFNSEFLMNSLAFNPLLNAQFNNKLSSAFKNVSHLGSFNAKNTSSASSGYSTCDDNNDSIKTEHDSNELTNEKSFEQLAGNCKLNSSASLAHIMNWIKSEPSSENFSELTAKILYSAVKWTKTQKNFVNLPLSDQILMVNDCLSELFILQMAENKTNLSDVLFVAEDDDEKRKLVQSFQLIIQKFSLFKVDLMEFYLLKSIVLFKSDLSNLQEKTVVETIQDECFNTLFNYNKLNYPHTARFGRLLALYSDIRKHSNTLIDESFLRNVLGKSDVADILLEQRK